MFTHAPWFGLQEERILSFCGNPIFWLVFQTRTVKITINIFFFLQDEMFWLKSVKYIRTESGWRINCQMYSPPCRDSLCTLCELEALDLKNSQSQSCHESCTNPMLLGSAGYMSLIWFMHASYYTSVSVYAFSSSWDEEIQSTIEGRWFRLAGG